ncbi:MAG: DUF3859 domain-containing protein [Planctomycetaceae bacterium]|jgi:hypothetical protein
MTRRKPDVRIRTWGIYRQWDPVSKQLPKIIEITTRIPAEIDIEFGMVVNIKRAKNRKIEYCIDHPGIADDQGNRRPPFEGTVFVGTNDWDFFLGDTIWEPVDDKLGRWRLTLALDGELIADRSFDLYRADCVENES